MCVCVCTVQYSESYAGGAWTCQLRKLSGAQKLCKT